MLLKIGERIREDRLWHTDCNLIAAKMFNVFLISTGDVCNIVVFKKTKPKVGLPLLAKEITVTRHKYFLALFMYWYMKVWIRASLFAERTVLQNRNGVGNNPISFVPNLTEPSPFHQIPIHVKSETQPQTREPQYSKTQSKHKNEWTKQKLGKNYCDSCGNPSRL